LWASLLLSAGPALAAALDVQDRPVQLVASLGLWAVWIGALGATLVPRTVTLTAVRIVVPAALPATAWALLSTAPDGVRLDALVGAGTAAAATIVVLTAFVGDGFVNGSSYGDERRLPLRPPALLLAGPVPLAWAVVVVGAVAGPLLLAAGRWVPGAIATVVGVPAAAGAVRSLHTLARRWLVFVPAGFVIHDPMTLAEPVLCTRRTVTHLGPAPADTTATDLTAGALGLAIEVELAEPAPAVLRARSGREAGTLELTSFLVAPSRPGEVLREARRRRMTVRSPT
jgi:hypothetical protein